MRKYFAKLQTFSSFRNEILFCVTWKKKFTKGNNGNNGCQGRSENLKKVPQNFIEVFNVDDVTAKTPYRKTNIAIEKKQTRVPKVITDVNLAS